MVIGFCGRMRSGKSCLADICESKGYNRLSFATPLKQLCADLLDISIDGLNKAKNEGTDIELYLGDDMCTILADETEIPLEQVKGTCNGKTIHDVREMLQFIGTDLIRKYNIDWHVNKIREMIEPGKNYVLDDVRFPNEKKMIEDLGGDCWFITRTTFDNISNHISETSITLNDCWNRIIINDTNLHRLIFKWSLFMADYKKSCTIRDKEFDRILENGYKDRVNDISALDIMFLPHDLFTYYPREFNKENIKSIKMNESKTVTIKYNDDSLEIIDNALTIEELKMLI